MIRKRQTLVFMNNVDVELRSCGPAMGKWVHSEDWEWTESSVGWLEMLAKTGGVQPAGAKVSWVSMGSGARSRAQAQRIDHRFNNGIPQLQRPARCLGIKWTGHHPRDYRTPCSRTLSLPSLLIYCHNHRERSRGGESYLRERTICFNTEPT